MKTTRKITSLVLALSAGVMISRADVLNWDPSHSGGSGGTGTWNLSAANWWNGSADVAWTDTSLVGTNAAVFGGTAGTVTLGSSLSASNLQFTAPGYTLSGSGTLTLGAGGIDASTLVSGTTTIGNPLSLSLGQGAWQVGAGGTLTVNGTISRATGASVDFSPSGITAASPSLANDSGGILDGWATTGNYISSDTTGDFLTISNGNLVICTNYFIVSDSGNTTNDVATLSGKNLVSGALNGPNDITVITNSVALNSLVAQGDVFINNGVTVTLNSGGLMLRGVSRWIIDQSPGSMGSAAFQSGLPTGEFFIHAPNANTLNWTIWPAIKDNGTTPATLIKDGPGLAKLANTNTYTGGTLITGGALGSRCAAPVGLVQAFGPGNITVVNGAELRFGTDPGNAFGEYDYTNTISINNGIMNARDGFHHVKGTLNVGPGGLTMGATYDNKGDALNNGYAKGLFIDGPVTGSGPITIQDSGLETVNPWDSSVVYFTSAAPNAYSGTITVNPFPAEGGSYVYLISTNALANATINLTGDNSPTGGRFGSQSLLFGSGTSAPGLGYTTIGALTGVGSFVLGDTLTVQSGSSIGGGVTLTIGNNNASTTYAGVMSGPGGIVKIGNGTLTLSGANTYTGDTVLNGGSLVLTGGWLGSSNVIVAAGRTLDASAVSPATMAANQILWGNGTFNGSFSAPAGSGVSAGTDGTYGTNTITGSLTLGAGAVANFDVGTSIAGPNDRVVLGGALTANNNVVHLKAPSTSVNLDSTGDYLLISAPSGITGTFATTPAWDVAPLNAAHYSIQTSNTAVYLHYSTVAGPTGVGSSSPFPALRNQTIVLKVTAANGTAGTVNSVVVDASALGGSPALALVNSGGNVWTNGVAIPATFAAPFSATLVATVTDTASLSASVNIPVSIVAGNDVWNGAGADANLSTALNWTNQTPPAITGDSLQFSGSAKLTPNVDNNYFVSGVLFDTTAGAYNIGSAANTLGLVAGSGVVNNSTHVQTLSAPLELDATTVSFNAASNDIVVSGAVSGTNGLTKTGSHALTLSGTSSYTGPTILNAGTLNITGTITPSYLTAGNAAGKSVLNISDPANITAANLFTGNTTNAVNAVYQTGGTLNLSGGTGDLLSIGNWNNAFGYYSASGGTLNINGISIGGENNPNVWPPQGTGDGIMDVNGATINNSGWIVLARGAGPQTGILNMFSGSLTYAGGGIGVNWNGNASPSNGMQTAIINVMGGSVTSLSQGVNFRTAGNIGILNLNGGLLEGTSVTGSGTVNFNGGTLQAAGSLPGFVAVDNAYIWGGGAVIDNNGSSIGIAQPLLAPTGSGVHGITSFTGGAGYIAPPIVTIVNGTNDTTGTGATAIAQINPATGTVTNIIITCPGVNYTATPIFHVSGGGATTAATITGAAPTPNSSGGLTSVGVGVLTLSATNNSTYTGNTIVGAGTLELVNPTLAQASTITVSNGAVLQLDFAGTNQIAGLVLNGVSKPYGIYNSTTASPYITGSDTLLVASPIASNPTNITFSVSGSGTSKTLSLSWPSDHLGWILQQDTNGLSNSSTNWFDVPGTATITTTNIPVNPAVTNTYYRLRHP